jgi:hypothetical protein
MCPTADDPVADWETAWFELSILRARAASTTSISPLSAVGIAGWDARLVRVIPLAGS